MESFVILNCYPFIRVRCLQSRSFLNRIRSLDNNIIMVVRPVVIAVICVGLFLILESLMVPKAMALRTNQYRMEDHIRSPKRRNYILQRARDRAILRSLEKRGESYNTELESLDLDAIGIVPEGLAYMMDYTNRIDDEFLLGKSVETRTRKRQYTNQAIQDPPCSCKTRDEVEVLEGQIFPTAVLTRICDETQLNRCPTPYTCQNISYPMVFLRHKKSMRIEGYSTISEDDRRYYDLIPNPLNTSWITEYKNISVGCQCTKEYKKEVKRTTMEQNE